MRDRALFFVGLCLLLLGLGACASGGTKSTVFTGPEFTTKAELHKIASEPLPGKIFASEEVPVETWTLEGPFPTATQVVPYEAAGDPWQASLQALVKARPGKVFASEGAHCAARELGRFYLKHGGFANQELRGFVARRCGISSAGLSIRTLGGTASPDASESDLATSWADDLKELAQKLDPEDHGEVGIWFGRQDEQVLLFAVSSHMKALLEPIPFVPTTPGVVRIKGELLVAAESIGGLVNHGDLGVQSCEVNKAIKLPRFEVTCPVDARDASTAINFSYLPPGRLLSRGVFSVVVTPAGEMTEVVYTRPDFSESEVVYDMNNLPGFQKQLVETINLLRTKLDLKPLRLSPTQSIAATGLAPHFFAAELNDDQDRSEQIVLGMMAGWEVDKVRYSGPFQCLSSRQIVDQGDLLGLLLDSPDSRRLIFDPDVSTLALGTYKPAGEDAVGLMIYTYITFEEASTLKAERNVLHERLRISREEVGRKKHKKLKNVRGKLNKISRALEAGDISPDEALELVSQAGSNLAGYRYALTLEASELESVEFGGKLQEMRDLSVAFSVAHYRPKGSPWYVYLVLVLARSHDTSI